MKLKFIKPEKAKPKYRSNVHRTGRIGFTIEAAKTFGLAVDKSMALAVNSEDANDKSIYGILVDNGDENGYKIQKAGAYYSVKAAAFFDFMKTDYSKGDLSYTLSPLVIEGESIIEFIPNPRKVMKSKKE